MDFRLFRTRILFEAEMEYKLFSILRMFPTTQCPVFGEQVGFRILGITVGAADTDVKDRSSILVL